MTHTYDEEVVALLARLALFADLSSEVLQRIASSLTSVHLEPGEVLFSEGDPSDGLYILLSGRVHVNVSSGDSETHLHELGRGEVLGEVSLVASSPRTATVRAVRATTVLHLSRSIFQSLVADDPALGMKLAALLADRLVRVDRTVPMPSGCRTLHLRVRDGESERFVSDLITAAEATGRTTTVRASDRPAGAAGDPRDPAIAANLASWLRRIEESNDIVLLVASDEEGWDGWCMREAEASVEVGMARDHHRNSMVLEPWLTHHRVFVHPPGAFRGNGVPRIDNVQVHHVRAGSTADAGRLVRILTGRASGVVLSGGGARGFAHLGVLRALEELGRPIDVVGGTSIGAVAGSLLAAGYEHEERVEILSRALKRRRSVFPLTFPVLSVASDRKVEALLEGLFGDTAIEDLWVGFFCVSANLTRAETVVHDRGSISAALRATFSLPGVLPPVVKDGDLLIDGGVMNNLPVDVMRRVIDRGEITAIDLRPVVDLRMTEGNGAADWRVLAGTLSGASDHPTVIDVLMRTVELGSAQAQRAGLEAAAVTHYLRPPAQHVRLSDFKAGNELVELGYRYALEKLTNGDASS